MTLIVMAVLSFIGQASYARAKYFWFGPHQFLVCEALLSQAGSERVAVTANSVQTLRNRLMNLNVALDNDTDPYSRVEILPGTTSRRALIQSSSARLKQLQAHIRN